MDKQIQEGEQQQRDGQAKERQRQRPQVATPWAEVKDLHLAHRGASKRGDGDGELVREIDNMDVDGLIEQS